MPGQPHAAGPRCAGAGPGGSRDRPPRGAATTGDDAETCMATYTQASRPLTVTTPLGADDLLVTGFTGREAISQLFRFQLELLAENGTDVPFESLLGQSITVGLNLPDEDYRPINGICIRLSQGAQDDTFTSYTMEIVPRL